MSQYKAIQCLEWCEEDDCIRVIDSEGREVHVYWNADLDNLLENPNFGPKATVRACMLTELDHYGGEISGTSSEAYDLSLKEVFEIIRTRDLFLAAMARKRESAVMEGITSVLSENHLKDSSSELFDQISALVNIECETSILFEYLDIVTDTYTTEKRLRIDFYLDELDSIEQVLFDISRHEKCNSPEDHEEILIRRILNNHDFSPALKESAVNAIKRSLTFENHDLVKTILDLHYSDDVTLARLEFGCPDHA